jgi:hypothetical protein
MNLIVCFAVFLTLTPQLGKVHINDGHHEANCKDAKTCNAQQGTKDSPLFFEQVSTPKTQEEAAQNKREEDERQVDKKLGRWFNILLILAAFLQVGVMYLQWRMLSRQTTLIKQQADISMNSERALLAEEIRFASDMPLETPSGLVKRTVAVVTFHNHGRTPAELVSVELRYMALNSGEELPEIPDYGLDGAFWVNGAKGVRVTPQGTRMFLRYYERSHTLSDDEITSIYKNSMRLYCYGRVTYRDIFGRGHKLQFCQRYRVAAPGAPSFVSGFQSDGPPAYNETT